MNLAPFKTGFALFEKGAQAFQVVFGLGRQEELVLAYRWLLTERDTDSLSHLVRKINSNSQILEPRLLYWQAYALNWMGRGEESLVHLRQLLGSR